MWRGGRAAGWGIGHRATRPGRRAGPLAVPPFRPPEGRYPVGDPAGVIVTGRPDPAALDAIPEQPRTSRPATGRPEPAGKSSGRSPPRPRRRPVSRVSPSAPPALE